MKRKSLMLTAKQLMILEYLSIGKTMWEIATIMGLKSSNVKHHITKVRAKLAVSNAAHAVGEGFRQGLLITKGEVYVASGANGEGQGVAFKATGEYTKPKDGPDRVVCCGAGGEDGRISKGGHGIAKVYPKV